MLPNDKLPSSSRMVGRMSSENNMNGDLGFFGASGSFNCLDFFPFLDFFETLQNTVEKRKHRTYFTVALVCSVSSLSEIARLKFLISVFLAVTDGATTSSSSWTWFMADVGDKYSEIGDGDKEEDDELDSLINFGLGMGNTGFIMVASVRLKNSNQNEKLIYFHLVIGQV